MTRVPRPSPGWWLSSLLRALGALCCPSLQVPRVTAVAEASPFTCRPARGHRQERCVCGPRHAQPCRPALARQLLGHALAVSFSQCGWLRDPEGETSSARKAPLHPSQQSFWKKPITALLCRVLQCCPHWPLSRGPTCRPASPGASETPLGRPLYAGCSLLALGDTRTSAEHWPRCHLRWRSLQGPLQDGPLSIAGVTGVHVQEATCTAAYVVPGVIHRPGSRRARGSPPQRPPSLTPRQLPGGCISQSPPHSLSVGWTCEEGQGPGCPQPMADPKAPISYLVSKANPY